MACALASSYGARARAQTAGGPEPREVRALWVQRLSLTSPGAIAGMVEEAQSAGFNTLLVQVRGRGDAFFTDSVEPRAAALLDQPLSFDPLAEVLAAARPAGLRVHVWINVNLVANAVQLPGAREHVIYRHPEWLMVPRELARDMASIRPDSPEYIGRLARYVRAHAAQVEGLYLSPIHEGASAHAISVVSDLVERYDVDGVHFDYIRYPNDEFDYSPGALSAFRDEVVRDLEPVDRRRYDARLSREPTIYADAFPERWGAFRRARLTALVGRLREAVAARRPGVTLSAAVLPDARDAFVHRLQDWRHWMAAGLIDAVCPMAYTTDPATFRTQIEAVRVLASGKPVWAGIGAYRLSSSETIENIVAARELGAHGIVLFSYDNLSAVPGRPQLLSDIGRAAFD